MMTRKKQALIEFEVLYVFRVQNIGDKVTLAVKWRAKMPSVFYCHSNWQSQALVSIDPGFEPNPFFLGLPEHSFVLETPLFSSNIRYVK